MFHNGAPILAGMSAWIWQRPQFIGHELIVIRKIDEVSKV
jgi:hypothetical protein